MVKGCGLHWRKSKLGTAEPWGIVERQHHGVTIWIVGRYQWRQAPTTRRSYFGILGWASSEIWWSQERWGFGEHRRRLFFSHFILTREIVFHFIVTLPLVSHFLRAKQDVFSLPSKRGGARRAAAVVRHGHVDQQTARELCTLCHCAVLKMAILQTFIQTTFARQLHLDFLGWWVFSVHVRRENYLRKKRTVDNI